MLFHLNRQILKSGWKGQTPTMRDTVDVKRKKYLLLSTDILLKQSRNQN